MEDRIRQRFGAGVDDPALRLIETLRWDGARFPLLARHLARLAASAADLSWTLDPERITAALAGAATGGALARVRLTVGGDGVPDVTTSPLPPTPEAWDVMLAGEGIDSRDPWRRVKSTHRTLYDALRGGLPPGIGEVLVTNERGEIAEGTITNVFFATGSGICTPPLTAGCLPGVLRAELIADGCREVPLPVSALSDVQLWVGNAVRGLIPARVRPQVGEVPSPVATGT